jgi:GNAT superfamily N-acetyltransferase
MKPAIGAAHQRIARPKKRRSVHGDMKRPVKRAPADKASAESKPQPHVAIRIRRGAARDVPLILAQIRGLADYERLSREVTATEAQLKKHGFGRRRYFQTLICSRGRRAVGFALYFFTYSTFLARPTLYIEDLFVLPEERGNGAGTRMLQALARIAVSRGCGRMEWAVLDWNAPAIRFYRRMGARLRKEWILTRVTGDRLRRLAEKR